ncbi:MAG: hypothetical protein ACE5Q6_27265 [Dehalococcoidia bacterium]
MMQRQAFRVSDALRCMLVNAPRGENLACPRQSFSGARTLQNALLWKDALSQPRDRVTLAAWQGIRTGGLVSARTRSGERAWEIDRLYLPENCSDLPAGQLDTNHSPDTAPIELLEQLVQALGWRAAERVFLRLTEGSPIIPAAQRSGFFPSFQETMLEGWGGGTTSKGSQSAVTIRERLPHDDYALFQLFSAAAPVAVRESLGLTFDQWRDSREPHCRKGTEWVLETDDGRISAWLGIWPGRPGEEVELMLDPRHPELLSDLVELALARPGWQRWLVPDYQAMVIDRLRYRGFHEVGQYTMLNKRVTAPVLAHGMAPMEA